MKNIVESMKLTIFAVKEFSTTERMEHTAKARIEKRSKNNLIFLFIISATPQ